MEVIITEWRSSISLNSSEKKQNHTYIRAYVNCYQRDIIQQLMGANAEIHSQTSWGAWGTPGRWGVYNPDRLRTPGESGLIAAHRD